MNKLIWGVIVFIVFIIITILSMKYLNTSTIATDHNNSLYETEDVVVNTYENGENRLKQNKQNEYNELQLIQNILVNTNLDYDKKIKIKTNSNTILIDLEDKNVTNKYKVKINNIQENQ